LQLRADLSEYCSLSSILVADKLRRRVPAHSTVCSSSCDWCNHLTGSFTGMGRITAFLWTKLPSKLCFGGLVAQYCLSWFCMHV